MNGLQRMKTTWWCADSACGRLLRHEGEEAPRCPSCGGPMEHASDRQVRLAAAGVVRWTRRRDPVRP